MCVCVRMSFLITSINYLQTPSKEFGGRVASVPAGPSKGGVAYTSVWSQ